MKNPVVRGQYLAAIRNRGKDVLLNDMAEAMDLLIGMAAEKEAAERERDKLITQLSIATDRADINFDRAQAAETELARLKAAAGEPVSFEWRQHYSGIGKSGPWVKLNDERTYEKLKLKHSGDGDYEFRELYTAAQPQPVVELPEPYDDGHGNLWLPQDAVISVLDEAGVKWEVKK